MKTKRGIKNFTEIHAHMTIKYTCKQSCIHVSRPSDRVSGCGTAQCGQTRTITLNSQKPAKSHTILKDILLKHLIKSGILLINKIPKDFLGYFQAIYLPKQSKKPRFPQSLELI